MSSDPDAWDVVSRIERTDLGQQQYDQHMDRLDKEAKDLGFSTEPGPTDNDHRVAPGTVIEHRGSAGQRRRLTIKARKDDDTGWWLEEGGGVADHVLRSEWDVVPENTGNPKDAIGDTKPPLHLVPAALDIYASLAMKNGADKYGPFNWRTKPVRAEVYIAAARRHLAAWFDGEDVAEDSGVHHLAHAAAGLAILLDAMATGNLIDDRPVAGPSARLIAEFTAGAEVPTVDEAKRAARAA